MQKGDGTAGGEANRWQTGVVASTDAELKAESPGGLGTPPSLKTSVIKRSGEQTWDGQAALGPLKGRTGSLASKGS